MGCRCRASSARCARWGPSVAEVRYFAAAEEAAGRESETLEAATVGELKALLVQRYGELMGRVVAAGSFLVDGIASRDDAQAIGARVDVLPPFAGG
jgi:molybdopterin synthase sulfur carrier subunit